MSVREELRVAFGIKVTAEEFEAIKAVVAPTMTSGDVNDPETVMRAALKKAFVGVEDSRRLDSGGLSYDLIGADTPFEWVLGDCMPKVRSEDPGTWTHWARVSDPDYWDLVSIRTDHFRLVFRLGARPVGLFYGLYVS